MRPSNLENSHSHSRISRVFKNEGSVWVRELARVTLKNSHSHSRISRVFENESSIWVRGSNEGVLEKTSKFKARTRAVNLRIHEDSRKLPYELFWQNRAVGMYQILEVHQFIQTRVLLKVCSY